VRCGQFASFPEADASAECARGHALCAERFNIAKREAPCFLIESGFDIMWVVPHFDIPSQLIALIVAKSRLRILTFDPLNSQLGIAVGEAIGLACEGVQLRSLGALHEYIGGPHGSISSQLAASGDVSLHVLSSNLGVAIGAWCDWGAGAMCAAQSVTSLQRHDVGDVMMRLLRVYRTGRGACRPGR